MRLFSLGSGSSGNAFILTHEGTSILIDCGVGVRVLRKTLTDLNLIGKLSGVLISHEHSDHVRSLASLRKSSDCPYYATRGTFDAIGRSGAWYELKDDVTTTIRSLAVTPVAVTHDAAEPVGFIIEAGSERVAIFTDLGCLDYRVVDVVAESTMAVVESNYCEEMLRLGPYPAFLKRRIRSASGHLSNDDCASLLSAASGGTLSRVWLAHLSEKNNTPQRASSTATAALKVAKGDLHINVLPRKDVVELTAQPQQQLRLGD